MSLIHWWPLNGNLKDYGIRNVTLINSGATLNNNGKIGKTYEFDGSSSYLEANLSSEVFAGTNHPFSIAFWLKFTDDISSRKIIFGNYGLSNSFFNIEMSYGSSSYNGKLRFDWLSSIDHWFPATGVQNVWQHYVVTFDGTNKISMYFNGSLVESFTGTLASVTGTRFFLGRDSRTGDTALKGFLNDFRIYNHCLSLKEVKEISKGLVLHYTFEDAYAEGTTNIRPWSSTINSTTITGWDTTKNDGSTAYTRSGWGYGYNSGVPSPSIGYHAHWVYLDGELVMKFPNLNNEVGQRGRWLGISAGITIPWTAGKKYTISWEQRTDNLNLKPFGGVYYKLTSSSSNAFNDGCPALGPNTKVNVWERVSKTFTVNSGYDGSVTSASIYVYGYSSSQEGTVYVRNVQVEYKDHVTPFTASARSNSLVYDSSGYGNNAVVSGNIQIVPESISGLYSMKFDGSSAIRASNFYLGNEWSYGCWIKSAASNRGWEGVIIQNTDGGDADMQLGFYTYPGGNRIQSTANGQYNSSISFTYDDTWKHLFATFDGTNLKTYINGQLVNTKSITNALLVRNTVTIGARYRGSSYDAYFLGNIDDVKFYAKVFSAEEVLAEYQTKASIDRDGNLYTGEFVEENDRINIAKTDVIEASVFEEGTSLVKMVDGYAELEYIQSDSSGYAYINTLCPIYSGDSWRVEMELMMGSTWFSGYQSIFNSTLDSDTFECWINNTSNKGNLNVRYNGTALRDIIQFEPGNKYRVAFNYANTTLNAYVNDGLKKTTTIAKTTRDVSSVYLTIGHSVDATTFKYYNVKLYKDTVLLRNFIPAKRNKDNVIGMYDTVNRQFYTSSGSGSFTAGPEKGNLSIVYSKQIIEN